MGDDALATQGNGQANPLADSLAKLQDHVDAMINTCAHIREVWESSSESIDAASNAHKLKKSIDRIRPRSGAAGRAGGTSQEYQCPDCCFAITPNCTDTRRNDRGRPDK